MTRAKPSFGLSRLIRDDRGSMLPLLAAMVILAVSGAAIAVDLARAHALRQQLQLTADAAALAAAVNLPDVEAARNAAYRYAQRNMPGYLDVITADDIAFGQWDSEARRVSASEAAPSAVRVTPSLTAEKGNAIATLFAGVLGHGLLDVSASAVAGKRSPMCILALEPDKSAALALDVLAEIEAPNCTVQVNSRHQIAFRMLATSRFQAEGLCVTGGAQTSLLGSVTPEPTTGCPPQPDPLADLEAPEIEDCDFTDTDLDGHHGTLQPGVYCGGLVVGGSSDVQLAAGLYVIKDGPLKISDSSKITGDGVTFFLTGKKAVIDFEDESELSLTAPAEGALAGILVFQDRDFGGEHVWDSKAPTSLFGTIYLPEGSLISESSNAITPVNSCNVLITKSLRFKFQSAVSIDLSQEHCRDYLPGAVLGTVALLD